MRLKNTAAVGRAPILIFILACGIGCLTDSPTPVDSPVVLASATPAPITKFWSGDCLECAEGWIECQNQCDAQTCANGVCTPALCLECDQQYQKCETKAGCENLEPGCNECLDEEQKCVANCEGDTDCINVCANSREFCWQDHDCDG
ncbi:MAG: hypothetical protein AAFQ82_17750, partial [Myxococcota bacterium]